MFDSFNSLYGMPVYEAPTKIVPVLQIDPDFKWISDECRAKVNASLLEKFGTKDLCAIPKGHVFMLGNSIIARPNEFAIIKTMIA